MGAGLSGIGAGYHLQTACADHSYVILEARDAIGGTWDLFRYPGIRSDSDMFTLGYGFRPWTGAKAIADGASIRDYIRDTARAFGIDRYIRYGHRIRSAAWSSAEALWTIEVDTPEGARAFTCGFFLACSGYYDYARGHTPDLPGAHAFAGRIVHPQFWPEDLDVAGNRVVVLGSGATAVTLVPALARAGARVTMLQRSPSYVVSLPSEDGFARRMRAWLPAKLAHRVIRARSVLVQMAFYRLARWRPAATRTKIAAMAQARLGPGYDVATHFTPRYDPWDQRMCLIPDGDLFEAIKAGAAAVVTGRLVRVTQTGVALESGDELPADIIVTATGLEILLLGGVALSVDGETVDLAKCYSYKGLMFSDVPNLALVFGYTNASWTLRADLASGYICRVLNAMRRRGMRQVTPRLGGAVSPLPFVDFSSGYIMRAADKLPKQGHRRPWRVRQNYVADLLGLRFGRLGRELEFSNRNGGAS
ncbi:NAD(P)/FAD-dependent oxidoreductase [Sphingomonas sp. H39-1-10]|uniref:flavin-containing monooxygenase n=1 Tax=Sphingomonas pollutisoli TaxID=3030829 RepID=UPI0023B8D77A|nr:NAD(P)/FAD-dependent oxidoreductase [Sphingomonas pollutisoli]MDF0488709.1 NAD(P)/FAD-dependent oxidoreductase [Sphingomonas pollutisoli]